MNSAVMPDGHVFAVWAVRRAEGSAGSVGGSFSSFLHQPGSWSAAGAEGPVECCFDRRGQVLRWWTGGYCRRPCAG